MPNDVLLDTGTEVVVADTTDYSDNQGFGARTHQIDLTSVASGAARQSDKIDLQREASSTRLARLYQVSISLEWTTAPASLEVVDVYVGFSYSGTAGTGNPGGLSGSDAAYTGTSGDSLDDSLKQLIHVGSLSATADATTAVQIQQVGFFVPEGRYAMFVVDNNTAQALFSDAVEMAIRVEPYVDEIQ